ncbi:MAG: conjugal transfer protein TraF [Planctomycetes bacterium]|nr:conjugal transfer protein TraF [Planctomycetota bacterium]
MTLVLILALTPGLAGEDWIILGPKAMGMGGAGVASVRGGYGMYWNPATLAQPYLRKPTFHLEPVDPKKEPNKEPQKVSDTPFFDAEMHASANLAAVGGVLPRIALIGDLVERIDFNNLEQKLRNGQSLTEQEAQDVLKLLTEAVPGLEERGEGVIANAGAGMGARVWRLGFSALGLAYAGAVPVVDLEANLAVGNQGIGTITNNLPPAGQLSSASQAFAQTLANDPSLNITLDQAQRILFQAEQTGIDTSSSTFQSTLTDVLSATTTSSDVSQSFINNQSGARLRGILMKELAIGYGQPVFDWLALGVSLKAIHATTYFNPLVLEDLRSGSGQSLLEELIGKETRQDSMDIGIDAGVLLRPADWLVAGVAGKNLNRPRFDVNVGPDYVIEPQARAGLAMLPFDWLTLAADLDLFTNHSEALPGFKSQVLGGGAELNLLDALFIRAGASQNLRDPDEDVILHAGLGMRVWYFGLDAAVMLPASFSRLDKVANLADDLQNLENLPDRVGVSVMLGFDIPF